MLPRDSVITQFVDLEGRNVTRQFDSFSIKKDTSFMWYVIFYKSVFLYGENYSYYLHVKSNF